MNDFAAIDFETANKERTSVCSVGIVVVRDGIITEMLHEYIRPVPNYYSYWATGIHGICKKDTNSAPAFPDIWKCAESIIHGLPLVAHNSTFDEGCLKAVHNYYDMVYPNYTFYCTLRAARRKLPGLVNYQLHTVALHIGFELKNHHNALADAEACAQIAKLILL